MPPKPPSDSSFPTHTFATASLFSSFLSTNPTLPGIFLKLAKKSSGITSITASEAVEVALCHGWIDGRANSVDSTWWTVRYTPRRAKSLWSAKNVRTVERLVSEGKMQEEGLRCVEEAKEDGRWERAYGGPADMEVPEDFSKFLDLEGNEDAKGMWKGLNKTKRYSVLWRVETASVKSRKGVIERLVDQLGEGIVPGEKREAKEDGKGGGKVKRDAVEKKTRVKKGQPTKDELAAMNKDLHMTSYQRSIEPRRPGRGRT